VSEDIPALRLQNALRGCRQHAYYMRYALDALAPLLPLTAQRLQSLDAETVQDLDQFVLRFGKLQDAIGMRLLPAVLSSLQEPYERRPMLDKLLFYLEDLLGRSVDLVTDRALRPELKPDVKHEMIHVCSMALREFQRDDVCNQDQPRMISSRVRHSQAQEPAAYRSDIHTHEETHGRF